MSVAARPAFLAPPRNLGLRKAKDRAFIVWGLLATGVGLATLVALILDLVIDGGDRLSLRFLLSFPSADPAEAGILSAWVGSVLVILTTAAIAIPLGVLAGIYLEEYAPKNWMTNVIEIAVSNLAGVPSIIFGLLALGLFVQTWDWGQSVLTAGMTLALLILPVVIVATREAVRAVPLEMRQGALALGATKWQATRHHVLPYALPGVVTGVIIGISRAIGETAPLLCIGALTFVAFLPFQQPNAPMSYDVGQMDSLGLPLDPDAVETVRLANGGTVTTPDGNVIAVAPGASVEAPAGSYVETTSSWLDALNSYMPWSWLGESYTVMPIQMFNWTSRPEEAFRENAAAAGIVLLAITLLMNGAAIWLRYRLRRKIKW